jgi:hypothetical protein
MAKSPTIQLPDPAADHARLESIAMVAVAAWGIGFVIMLGVARFLPHAEAKVAPTARAARAQLPGTEAEPTRIVSATRGLGEPNDAHVVRPAPLTDPRTAEVEQLSRRTQAIAKPAAEAEAIAKPAREAEAMTKSAQQPEAIAKAAPAAAPIAEPLAAAATPPAPLTAASAGDRGASVAHTRTRKREFNPGVLAYLHCEGSERPHARFPCPRDPKLEEQVWQALAALPMCETDPGAGSAELRLLLRKSDVQAIEWKPSASDPGLDPRALGKCAGAKLVGMTTRLRAPEGVVSFRFSLE